MIITRTCIQNTRKKIDIVEITEKKKVDKEERKLIEELKTAYRSYDL